MRRQRIKFIWDLLRGKYRNFIFINIEEEEMYKLFRGENFEVYILYQRLHKYVGDRIIKNLGKSEEELFYDKLNFEVNAEEHSKNKKK